MPPKGSKRAAPAEAKAQEESSNANNGELRRSARGGGHKAPEPKVVKPRAKKAKTAETADNGDEDKAALEATAGEETATPAKTDADAPPQTTDAAETDKADEAAKVDVPEENKDAEKEVSENKKSSGGKIQVGDILPEGLILKNEADEDVTISELTKEKGAVFFIYPKANTPGCTTQACDFRDNYAEFGPLGYDVYGLSGDSPKSQASWKTKHNFPYHLLCDPGQILTKVLGAAKGAKSNQRSHFIVEKGGKLVDAKYTVSPKDSCKLALEFVKSQQK